MKAKSDGKEDRNENLFPQILQQYKKKCDQLGIVVNLNIKQVLEKSIQTNKLETVKLDEIIGPTHIRAITQSFAQQKFNKLKNILIWKAQIGDQGIRNICKYLQMTQNGHLQIFDVLENQISYLGCMFMGKTLSLPFCKIKYLKFDDNIIGNKGLENLSIGLRTNPHLTKLSLKYCGIDEGGIKYLQLILANIHSKIRSIKIQGNRIGNKGIYEFLRVIELNQVLQKVNIADTGLNLLGFIAKSTFTYQKNQQLVENQQVQQQQQDNPEKNSMNVQNKIISLNLNATNDKKTKGKIQAIQQQNKKVHKKVIKFIDENDGSLQSNIMKLLSEIMNNNLLIRKYDLRFNPISDDAATILFQTIQRNPQIKDVQLNNNVDNQLRQNLDTLMRKRTGRMPKGKGSKKSKKKSK